MLESIASVGRRSDFDDFELLRLEFNTEESYSRLSSVVR